MLYTPACILGKRSEHCCLYTKSHCKHIEMPALGRNCLRRALCNPFCTEGAHWAPMHSVELRAFLSMTNKDYFCEANPKSLSRTAAHDKPRGAMEPGDCLVKKASKKTSMETIPSWNAGISILQQEKATTLATEFGWFVPSLEASVFSTW